MIEKLNLDGIRIGLCQQSCIPAQPEYNGAYFEGCIEDAEKEEVDLLVGVEGIQGYLIGDQYEYLQFLREIEAMNQRIWKATVGKKVAVAYGSVISGWSFAGEDGRVERHNGGYVVQNGDILHVSNKTLSPNYRMFPEARYFFDNRKTAEKMVLDSGLPLPAALRHILRPVEVMARDGRSYKLGQEFCEDMWHQDYAINPTAILAQNGAEIIVNHSASPWTWRKNNKRHRVVKELMQGIPSEYRPKFFVYVNRTGVEQSNKNFYVYDGSSAVYDSDGDLVFEVLPYEKVTKVFTFSSPNPKIQSHAPDDTKALHDAMAAVVDDFYGSIPGHHRFVYVGVSGGIDSSVTVAFLVSRLGCGRVIGVNMPYDVYNSEEGKDDAKLLAENFCIQYLVIPITTIVDQIAIATGVERGTLGHQNIQARCRMEVLAALAQKPGVVNGHEKQGGLFTANGNKVEMAFGYGTMYADIAGATMLLGDLVKREVYQLGDYLNREVYGMDAIPQRIFERKPTAELDSKRTEDPFDYGNLRERGYHDEWVRAVTEFRRDPLWFLQEYVAGTLEATLLLPTGHLQKLFPTALAFIKRLERDWVTFNRAYFKRMQCPPVPVFTRRAFGGDLAESLNGFDFATEAYEQLKKSVLASAGTRMEKV